MEKTPTVCIQSLPTVCLTWIHQARNATIQVPPRNGVNLQQEVKAPSGLHPLLTLALFTVTLSAFQSNWIDYFVVLPFKCKLVFFE